jgi:tetratricopeptide (TPR) repeat protein
MASFENAKVLHERGHVVEAIKEYDDLLNATVGVPDPEVLFYYGTALFQQGKAGLATVVLKQCIDMRPTLQSAFQNLGNCYRIALDFKGAEEIYLSGLELGPSAELEACLAGLWVNRGNPQKALFHYERSLAIEPRDKAVMFNSGLAHLELGNWKRGWELYDLGYDAGVRSPRQYMNLPKWEGEHGKVLIVWGEQGVGDEIMFASMIPDLQKICKRVIFDCHPRLVDTYRRSFPGVEIHGTRKNYSLEWIAKSDAEAHCSITTVAKYLRNDEKDFPGTPYLTHAINVKKPKSDKLRVGVTWSGGTKATHAHARSFPVETLLPILEQDCEFFSLQYQDTAAREVCELEEATGIHLKHFPSRSEHKNYDNTINFISTLDLVITVCTTVHHAAGALGVPCWTMVPSEPAWRYGLKGTKTPWYGNTTLYRQAKGEQWGAVIDRIAADLRRMVQNREKVAA